MLTVAIVILNWNGEKLLKEFLPEVVKNSQEPGCEVIIADNASTDSSIEYIQTHFPNLRIIRLDKNYGFAGGYNLSLQQVNAKYFILLNSDVAPATNWLRPMITAFEEEENLTACAPKILDYKNKQHFEYAGAGGGFIDKFGYTFCRGRIFNEIEKDTNQYNKSDYIFWASGCALMIRAKDYIKAGGLDQDFFAHMEEIDLCWRLKNMGKKIRYIPQSTIYHLGGGTLDQLHPHKTYLNFRNNLYMMYKNLSPKGFIKTFTLRLLLDGIAGLKFLLGGEFNHFAAVLKAHFSFYKQLPHLLQKRKNLHSLYKEFNHPEIFQKSIVKEFFINKQKHFSQISNFNNHYK